MTPPQRDRSRERLIVCRLCGGLRDPATIPSALRQRCGCEGSTGQPRWAGYDFNLRHELCRLCGATACWSGHRFAVWFCEPCRLAVLAANDRLGGYVIPIGRHSIHGAQAPRDAGAGQAEGLVRFVRGLAERMDLLERWRLAQVQELWVAAGFGLDQELPLGSLETAAGPLRKPTEDLVAGLLEHLTRPLWGRPRPTNGSRCSEIDGGSA